MTAPQCSSSGSTALADRIEKAVVLSVIEPCYEGQMLPAVSNPISDEHKALIVAILRSHDPAHRESAKQELADQAQALDMGYGGDQAATPSTRTKSSIEEIIAKECYVAAIGDGYQVSGIEQAATAIRGTAQQPVGCGDPNCKDPNCTYGKEDAAQGSREQIHNLRIALEDVQALLVAPDLSRPLDERIRRADKRIGLALSSTNCGGGK